MKNAKRFVICSDIHGDEQDADAVASLHAFCDDFKPSIRVLAGDLWDFRNLRKGASDDEKAHSLEDDWQAGMDFADRFFKGAADAHLLRGNHDERLWELAEADRGVISDYAVSGIVEINSLIKKMNCRMLPYHKRDGVLRIGSLKMLHGFSCGVFAARQTALIYGSCLFGHVHVVDQHSIAGLERRTARAVGCLCTLDFDYSARNPSTLRQSNGFAFGMVSKTTGRYFVNQAERIDGKWLIPTEFKEYR